MRIIWIVMWMVICVYGLERVVNDEVNANNLAHRMGHITALDDGKFAIAWVDWGNEDADVYFQIFNNAGYPLTEPVRVGSDYTGKAQSSPRIVKLSPDRLVVIWLDSRIDGNRIFAQIFDYEGNPLSSDFCINEDVTTPGVRYCQKPLLTSLDNYNFVVGWVDSSGRKIVCRIIDSLGSPVTSEFTVNPDSLPLARNLHPFSIFPIEGDSFGVVYIKGYVSTRSSRKIYLQRVYRDSLLGEPVFLWEPQYWNLCKGISSASLVDGRKILSYSLYSSYNLPVFQVLDSTGLPIDTPFIASLDTAIRFYDISRVAPLPDSGFVCIVGAEDIPLGHSFSIIAQRYDKEMQPVGNNEILVEERKISTKGVYCDILSDGKIAVLYPSYTEGNHIIWAGDICYGIYDENMNPVVPFQKVYETRSTAFSSYPAVARNIDGEFICVWYDDRITLDTSYVGNHNEWLAYGGNFDIYFQRFDMLGNLIGTNLRISIDSFNLSQLQLYPDIATLPNGYAGIIWHEANLLLPTYSGIFLQIFNKYGVPLSLTVPIGDLSFGQNANIAALYSNRFVVVWDRYFKIFDSLGNEIPVPDSVIGIGSYVIPFPDSGFGVVGVVNHSVYFKRFDKYYQPVGDTQKVNTGNYAVSSGYPIMAVLPNGNYVIAWEDFRNEDSTTYDIYLQAYDPQGNPIGGNYRVTDDPFGNLQICPSIAVNPENGYFVIAWSDSREGDGDLDIYAQVFNQNIQPVGANIKINYETYPPVNQILSVRSLSANARGVMFVWEDTRRHLRRDIISSFIPWDELINIKEDMDLLYSFKPEVLLKRNHIAISLYLNKKGKVSLKLINASGRVVYRTNGYFRQGKVHLKVPLTGYPSGVYFLRIKSPVDVFGSKIWYIRHF